MFFVPAPRSHFVYEGKRLPVFSHGWQPDGPGSPQRWEHGFDAKVVIELVARRGVRNDVGVVTCLPLANKVVSKQEALSGINLHNPVRDGIPEIPRAVLPLLHQSVELTS